jgi:hypothetical protein
MSAMRRITPPRGPPCPHPAQRSSVRHPGNGRCSALASSHGARIQASRSVVSSAMMYSVASRSVTNGFRRGKFDRIVKSLIP